MRSLGSAENATQRDDSMGAAMLHFTGDDEGLAKVLGQGMGKKPDPARANYDPAVQQLSNIKASIDSGKGIGRPTILTIMRNRARLAAAATGEVDNDKPDNGQKNINAVREAMATLKDGGEHDRLIAEQAALAHEVAERKAAETDARVATRNGAEMSRHGKDNPRDGC